ncbi:hypothetical protein QGM71_05200 [Virgibacillus sp. C22-A2]|uniref:Uncharacterized protein n=1 Tax=Virgibacillus tibetensis TaxID=3042313 RepID=A0ABU6KCN2_9BACI|nr:hypothetical protein [Virgibacillus sp. C22-A2]
MKKLNYTNIEQGKLVVINSLLLTVIEEEMKYGLSYYKSQGSYAMSLFHLFNGEDVLEKPQLTGTTQSKMTVNQLNWLNEKVLTDSDQEPVEVKDIVNKKEVS